MSKKQYNPVITVVAGVIGIVIGFTVVRIITTEFIKSNAKVDYSQLESSFLNSCTNSYNSLSGDYKGAEYCACVNNMLKTAYGDKFLTSDEFTNRISKTGYNAAENEKMAQCVLQLY